MRRLLSFSRSSFPSPAARASTSRISCILLLRALSAGCKVRLMWLSSSEALCRQPINSSVASRVNSRWRNDFSNPLFLLRAVINALTRFLCRKRSGPRHPLSLG
ncbi:hypothetical protein D3C78_1662890 [compost metagenome]